jgi:uncharacterized protein involved in exopolysaccharide biosynthesis
MTEGVDSDEISILDLLVTMAESWRLLVFGPLIAGLIGLGVAFRLPSVYQSEAKLMLPSEGVVTKEIATAVVATSGFLSAVGQKAGVLGANPSGAELASLANNLVAQVDRKSGLLSLSGKGPTPEKAQRLVQTAVAQLLEQSVPKGEQKKRIEIETANANRSIQGYQDAQTAVRRWLSKPLPGNTSEAFITALISLQANNEAAENRVARLQTSLFGLGDEAVVQPASLPWQRSSPKPSLIAVLTALATGFALVLWVFVRQAWRNAAADAESSDKLRALKAAFSGRKAAGPSN